MREHTLSSLSSVQTRLSDVGRTSGPPVAEGGDGAASEASEWENREREEQLALLKEEEERLGEDYADNGGHFFSPLFVFPWSFICLSFAIQLLAVSEREAST